MYHIPVWRCQLVKEGSTPAERQAMQSPREVAQFLADYLHPETLDREHFVVALLDTRFRLAGVNTVSIGTLDSAPVHPREVFKPAILASAAAVVIGHNHPSGNPEPSPEDMGLTKRLREAGKLLGIEVLDHVILGEAGRFVSLKERGLL